MAEVTKEDVKEFIRNMSVLELSQLVKELEEEFGVSAAAPVAVAAVARRRLVEKQPRLRKKPNLT